MRLPLSARLFLPVLSVTALFATASTATAQEPEPQEPANAFEAEDDTPQELEGAEPAAEEEGGGLWDHLVNSDRLLGDLWGGRTDLEDVGLVFDLFYNGYLGSNLRGGIDTVLIPEENQRELAEIPANIKQDLTIKPVKWIDEVFEVALRNSPEPLGEGEAVVEPADKSSAEEDDRNALTRH